MILISHRGNLTGKGGDEWENHPDYIETALKAGFHVEIDVWYIKNQIYLGHDKPIYKIEPPFFQNKNLWCHAKNEDAITFLHNQNLHYFWHENDKYTLTSKGIIWCYPGSVALPGSIVLEWGNNLSPDYKASLSFIGGICSDYISSIKSNL